MTTKTRLMTALNGETPDVTPLSIYHWMIDDPASPRWRRLFDQGLGICQHCGIVGWKEHGVEDIHEERVEGGKAVRIHTRVTPVGSIRQVHVDGWHTEYFVKEPSDYRVLQWITEHTELFPDYEVFHRGEALVGEQGLAVLLTSRSPAMSINVDWAGTEQFCLDVALEVPELFDLYEARARLILEEYRIVAAGPGRFVKSFENLTISMLGPTRYRELLLSFYQRMMPMLESAGKRYFVHYDGALRVIADDIAAAPFHGIESLTEPPEGDMTYEQCRAAWPDKTFWANINVACYALPPEQLAAEVIAKRQRAGKRGLAFEISEDLPANWEHAIPVVLRTLEAMG